jgi:hypothetical protein
MGRAGSCFDDAAESWFSTLEWELFRTTPLAAKQAARHEVARSIDWYNRTRRHSACEMNSPVEFEAILVARAAATVDEERRETGLHNRFRAGKRNPGSTRHRAMRDSIKLFCSYLCDGSSGGWIRLRWLSGGRAMH